MELNKIWHLLYDKKWHLLLNKQTNKQKTNIYIYIYIYKKNLRTNNLNQNLK